jgi:hypothetical protein
VVEWSGIVVDAPPPAVVIADEEERARERARAMLTAILPTVAEVEALARLGAALDRLP